MLVIASRSPRLLAVLALAGLLGCSYGMVTDKESGAPLEGATIRVNAINVSYPDGSGNLIGTLPGEQIVKTWANAMPGSNGMGGWWYLNGYASVNPGDSTSLMIQGGWSRFSVFLPGYDPRFFFREHVYREMCPIYGGQNPYSAGPYPVDLSGSSQQRLCARSDFQLSSSGSNYVKDPDLFIDPRTLLDNVYTTERGTPGVVGFAPPYTCEGRSESCLRFSLAVFNGGAGDLSVEAPVASPTSITQHRFRRNSGVEDTPVNADFTTLVGDHLQFWNWVEIRLRVKNTTCADSATADQCPLAVPPASIAFCLNDATRFAGGAPEQFRRNDLYDCSNDGVSFRQGIGAAGGDVHDKSAIGQMFVTDGLHGQFWLEAEVNPQPPGGTRAVIESDYSNNLSRIVVTLP